jgi:hypothetical protein
MKGHGPMVEGAFDSLPCYRSDSDSWSMPYVLKDCRGGGGYPKTYMVQFLPDVDTVILSLYRKGIVYWADSLVGLNKGVTSDTYTWYQSKMTHNL